MDAKGDFFSRWSKVIQETPIRGKVMAKQRSKKGSWIVSVECTVTKQVVCDNCTEEEAKNDPFGHAVEETEVEQIDYKVKSVEENK